MTRRAQVQVRTAIPTGLRIEVDAGSFGQVITNLVQNACVHAWADDAPSRVLSVVGEDLGDALVIEVGDDGRGMDAETARRVWEPFFTTRRGDGGSGLGMHIVETVVADRFGGAISLDTAPGSGTRWRLRLPFGNAALRRLSAPPARSPAGAP